VKASHLLTPARCRFGFIALTSLTATTALSAQFNSVPFTPPSTGAPIPMDPHSRVEAAFTTADGGTIEEILPLEDGGAAVFIRYEDPITINDETFAPKVDGMGLYRAGDPRGGLESP